MNASKVGTRAMIFRTDPGRRPPPPRSGPRLVSHVPVVRSDHTGGDATLKIEGAFDAVTVGDINIALDAVVAEHPQRVTVDLDHVPLLDSIGVGAIVSLWKRVREQGGSVVVVHAHDQPLTVLKLLKLEVLFGEAPMNDDGQANEKAP